MKRSAPLFLLLVWLLSGCNSKDAANVNSLTTVNPYVFAYTSGIISKTDPILIEFAGPIVDEETVGAKADAGILEFSPGISGVASWENARTLQFVPASPLNSATTYTGTVNVRKLIKEAKGIDAAFKFEFRTKDQNLSMVINGLQTPNTSDLSKQEVTGVLYSSDVADPVALEETLTAKQNNRSLEISWEHSADQMAHHFTVMGVARTNDDSEVNIEWSAQPLGVKQRGSKTIEVPALGKFKVTEAVVLQEPEQYLLLRFSDPLTRNQNLNGLITLENYSGDLRFVIDNNEVRVFPARRLSGTYNVRINPGIRNIANSRLDEPGSWNVSFEELKPGVRLVGRGVIMPTTEEGLIFPFDAVGLNAVEVEIFKIFHNNILQFLQENRIGGSNNLRTVGRVILQKRIDLNTLNPEAATQRWTRYALDLSQLIEQDPKAIYQVRLGFRPDYTAIECSGEGSAVTVSDEQYDDDPEEIRSIMDSYYGINGYYSGYDWDNRDNPCFPEYYNSERFEQRNVISSNLGMITKMGQDKEMMVIVTDLRSSQPVSGAEITFYDYQQQPVGSTTTDGNGLARTKVSRTPFALIAQQGDQIGYLRLNDGDALSLSRFDVQGAVVQKGLKGFLYGERGVWRPGDSIFLNFILDDRANKLPENYPITYEVYNPKGQLFLKRTTAYNVDQVYPLHFSTNADDPTGNYRAVVQVGGASFRKILKVETIKPNRIKINLDFGGEILEGRETVSGQLEAEWLHGAPASGLRAVVEADLQPQRTRFDQYPSYLFDDPARQYSSGSPRTVFEGTLDAAGKTNVSANLLGSRAVAGMMRASFRTRVFEKGGDFSTDSYSIPYSPYSAYAGIEIPKNKYGEPRIEVNENGEVRFVVVDKDGKPLANRTLNVGFYRVSWRWWWDQGYDYVSRYNTATHTNAQASQVIRTNSKGEANWTLRPDQWGRYLVRVCDEAGGHCSGSYLYAGYPWYGDDDDGDRDVAAMLSFSSDQESYKVGDEVTLTIPSGKAGRILVTLENGSKVVDQFWEPASDGENTITFKATEAMSPTIYANVSLIQAHGQSDNDLPMRLYGVIPIKVEDPSTRLQPVADLPAELKPQQTFTVEVSESNKSAMSYTLAVVDEGLLGLTRFQTPNPHDAFYAREALGVKTWDVYDNVLGAFGGELERMLSIGGDGEVEPGETENDANRFKPVVMHLGPFKLKKGGKNKHTLEMPNYVGSVRVMVVAAEEGAYGAFAKSVPVRNPVMVLATLPRVLSPGDELTIPANVFVTRDNIRQVNVSLSESSGLVDITGGNRTGLSFQKAGDQIAEFSVKVKDMVGVARFTIKAEGGGESSTQEVEIQVRNPNPYQSEVFAKVIQAGEDWQQAFDAVGMPGTNEAILELSSIPPINLGRRLQYLLHYPYGCVEQTVSSAFPQIYVNRLMEINDEQRKQIPINISATINRLRSLQTSNGGFGYWPGDNTPHQWGTNYAGHFLLEAKANGYSVPTNMLNQWKNFQKKAARLWSPDQAAYGFYSLSSQQLNQAYRLYTLALAGEPDLSAMNRLRESSNLQLQARWRLAAAYALAGKKQIATQLVSNQSTEVGEYRELGYNFGNPTRDRAMILETTILLEDENRSAVIVQYLSDELSAGQWMSTQTTAYALLAISKYVGDAGVDKNLKFSYQVAGSQLVNAGSNSPVAQVDLGVLKSSGNRVTVKNGGNGKLFARLILNGQPAPGQEKGTTNDLQMQVRFTNTNGTPLDVSRLPQGKDFIAEVTVTHPNGRPITYEELALTQAFPSSWEILNSRMDDLSGPKQDRYDYQDIRDDRVNTFFDLRPSKTATYRVQLNAAYMGKFYLPGSACQAMYDNSISAFSPGQWVEVVEAGSM